MSSYTKAELESAKKAISSSIGKITKAHQSLSMRQPPPKPQITLAERNLAALKIAIDLIERELEDCE